MMIIAKSLASLIREAAAARNPPLSVEPVNAPDGRLCYCIGGTVYTPGDAALFLGVEWPQKFEAPRKARKLTEKQLSKKLDALVNSVYGKHCRGEIRILDMPKVFEAGTNAVLRCGREASAQGIVPFDVESCREAVTAAMVAAFEEVRVK